MNDFDYLEPTTISEACALLQKHGPDARVYAGGAYLSILMKQGLLRPICSPITKSKLRR
jgi:carbon-monoxide dehydrogenase medium subunit